MNWRNKGVLGIGSIVALLAAGAGWAYFRDSADRGEFKEPAFGPTVAKHMAAGCIARVDTITANKLSLIDGDPDAGVEVYRRQLRSGGCYVFSEGDKVFVDDKAHYPIPELDKVLHGLICVRLAGNPSCYWVGAGLMFPELRQKVAD